VIADPRGLKYKTVIVNCKIIVNDVI